VASEGLPFSKTGGLADVVEALPRRWWRRATNAPCVAAVPRNEGDGGGDASLTIPMGGARLRFPAIADGTILNGVRYFFVEDAEYFDRDGIVWWEQRRLSG